MKTTLSLNFCLYSNGLISALFLSLTVTFDRKIKRSDLNVVISRPRLSTCSYVPVVVPRFRLSYVIGLAPVGVSCKATYCEPANSTKSRQVDLGIYPDKANISYSQCDS